MGLRPYQRDLVAQVRTALESASVVLQLPTGGGKTHIAADIAMAERRRGKRVWFVCHRAEIVRQTCDALDALGVPHGVVVAGQPVWDKWQVQVCSVGKLRRALKSLTAPDAMIWDECHHVPAKSWSEVRAMFPKAKHLGLTATPARLDGRGLEGHFDQIICGPDTRTLINEGYLSPYRLFGPTTPDMRGVGVRAGDYAKDDVEREMNKAVVVGDAIKHYERLVPGARAIAFCCSVRASRDLVERFRAAGIAAEHVDGTTPAAERDAAVAALRSGGIKVLSNVELFTEGFDAPATEAVILLRPTKSFALYRQMIGRVLRTAPGKAITTILDHAGLVHEHGLPDDEVEWTLSGYALPAKRALEDGAPRLRRCEECTAIHPWAAECPECGRVYGPNERTIDEVFGELREISKPAGCITHSEAAALLGVSVYSGSIRRLIKSGLPTKGIWIPRDEALEWARTFRCSSNIPPLGSALGAFERREDFAARVGKTKSGINKWVVLGLPCGPNGWVNVELGVAWVDRWRKDHAKPEASTLSKVVNPIFLGETFAEFQARTGVIRSKSSLRRAGLPLHSDGTVNTVRADEWLKTVNIRNFTLFSDQEPVATFCRRIGRWPRGHSRQRLLDAGLPLVNGKVPINEALSWAYERHLIKDTECLREMQTRQAAPRPSIPSIDENPT